MKAAIILLLPTLLAIPECGTSYGDKKALLVLRSEDGEVRYFDLGNRKSFKSCADMALLEFEGRNIEREPFWVRPDFGYGGYKAADDWIPHQILGFICSIDETLGGGQ